MHIRMILICLTCTPTYDISQVMGVPAKLTERQIKFAELLVYNEGRLSPAEAAFQAGYKTRPRQVREFSTIRTNICTEFSYKRCNRKMLGL